MTAPLAGYRVLDLADEKGAACAKTLADLGADVLKVEPPDGEKKRGQAPFGRAPDPFLLPDPGKLPLEGIRVVEFTTGIVGPSLGRLLAEFGAESIKVESHKRPDFSRGPALTKGISFADNSRSKKSVSIDATRPEGQKIVEALIQISDVVIDNFSAGVMRKLGFDYPKVRETNPSVVMISMQGLGATESHSVTFGQNIAPIVGLTYEWNHPGATKPVGSPSSRTRFFCGGPAARDGTATACRHTHETFKNPGKSEEPCTAVGRAQRLCVAGAARHGARGDQAARGTRGDLLALIRP